MCPAAVRLIGMGCRCGAGSAKRVRKSVWFGLDHWFACPAVGAGIEDDAEDVPMAGGVALTLGLQ